MDKSKFSKLNCCVVCGSTKLQRNSFGLISLFRSGRKYFQLRKARKRHNSKATIATATSTDSGQEGKNNSELSSAWFSAAAHKWNQFSSFRFVSFINSKFPFETFLCVCSGSGSGSALPQSLPLPLPANSVALCPLSLLAQHHRHNQSFNILCTVGHSHHSLRATKVYTKCWYNRQQRSQPVLTVYTDTSYPRTDTHTHSLT